MYILNENILNNKINITNLNDISNIQSNIYYVCNPYIFYKIFPSNKLESYNKITYTLQDIFYFSEEVILNTKSILYNENKYISIHLRLGDKYLETDSSFIHCKNDTRKYNEENLFNFIENNYNKIILFFCDNHNYKLKIKNKYKNIIITEYEIGHTSLLNTTDIQVLNSLTDFYLMTNSEEIVMLSCSGFPVMASKFKNISITKI